MAAELEDRFGTLPPEVKNLFWAVKIKTLAHKAGIESISNEHGEIVLQLFEGMRFDRQKLAPFLKYGIKIGTIQLEINYRRLGKDWRKVLEEMVRRMG